MACLADKVVEVLFSICDHIGCFQVNQNVLIVQAQNSNHYELSPRHNYDIGVLLANFWTHCMINNYDDQIIFYKIFTDKMLLYFWKLFDGSEVLELSGRFYLSYSLTAVDVSYIMRTNEIQWPATTGY